MRRDRLYDLGVLFTIIEIIVRMLHGSNEKHNNRVPQETKTRAAAVQIVNATEESSAKVNAPSKNFNGNHYQGR